MKVNHSCWRMRWTESDRCFLFKDHGLKWKRKSQVENGYNRVLQRWVLGWILFNISLITMMRNLKAVWLMTPKWGIVSWTARLPHKKNGMILALNSAMGWNYLLQSAVSEEQIWRIDAFNWKWWSRRKSWRSYIAIKITEKHQNNVTCRLYLDDSSESTCLDWSGKSGKGAAPMPFMKTQQVVQSFGDMRGHPDYCSMWPEKHP